MCKHKKISEGYLILYQENGNEIHANLINKDSYNKIVDNLCDPEKCMEINARDPLNRWFTQTSCNKLWPYNNINILDTVCIYMY